MLKNKLIYIPSLAALLFTQCTGDFEKLNTNPIGLTEEQMNADYKLISALLYQAQRNVIIEEVGSYQLSENLSSDAFSGYMSAPTPFRSNSNNLTYELVDGWNNRVFNERYINVMNPTHKVIEFAKNDPKMADIDALARILRVFTMARVSDKVGPIIYSKYNQPDNNTNIEYDSQKDAYTHFFTDLDISIKTLKTLKGTPASVQAKASDLAYTTNHYDNWLRVANTLRLRLALRIVYIDPTLAKQQAELALDPANGGLLESNEQNLFVNLSVNHPLNIIGYEWSDTRMGAPIESIMGGYNDPRISAYFNPAADPLVAGQYKGVRSGIRIDEKSRYDLYSQVKRIDQDKMQLMVSAEAYFLKAEAALRGYSNAGTAKDNYEKGIRASLSMYSIPESTITAYINNDSNSPKAYIDPKSINAKENDINLGSPYLSTAKIKWNEAGNKNKKLEQIITQKWIAIFPDGGEAWAEYRRTGYPILFPNIINYSAGVIPTIPGVRRIPLPLSEYNTNGVAVKKAVSTLNGPDNGATRLWWDVENKTL